MKQLIKSSYGIHTFASTEPWTDAELKKISAIEEKYRFKPNCLADALLNLIYFVKARNALIKSNPSHEEQIAYFQEIIDASDKLGALLDMVHMGVEIKKKLSAHYLNSTRKINYLRKALTSLTEVSEQSAFNLRREIVRGNKSGSKTIPQNSDSAKKKTIVKPVLVCLVEIFEQNSFLNPSVYASSFKETHFDGDLFNFCREIIPLLERKSGLKIAKATTVGAYLKKMKAK